MDLQQAKIILNKINALYKNLSSDEANIASIEKELMRSYITQLYEAFLDVDQAAPTKKKVKKTKVVEDPEFEVVEPKAKRKPAKKEYVPPKIIEIPDSLKDLSTEEPPAPAPKPKPEPVKPKPAPTPSPRPSTKNVVNIDSLLEHKQATELSEKLSERPIRDLTKALSINDRLFFMNELFAKNQNALTAALEHLNQYTRLEEAKPYLSELADQYDWLDKEKKDTATNFIKLVRRRYN